MKLVLKGQKLKKHKYLKESFTIHYGLTWFEGLISTVACKIFNSHNKKNNNGKEKQIFSGFLHLSSYNSENMIIFFYQSKYDN